MADNLPVRERVLAYLKAKFEAVTSVAGEQFPWEAVVRAPLSDQERGTQACLSIQEGRERKLDKASMVEEKFLDITIEWEVRAYMGEDPATYNNLVLADIQKTVGQDRQCGGMCLDMQETGSSVDVTTSHAPVIGGIVFFTIHYRHIAGDPTRAIGE